MSRIKLKICGVVTITDAIMLSELGVDYIGINLIPSSSRCVDLQKAVAIADVIRNTKTKSVLLFQDQPLTFVRHAIRLIEPDIIQLHGNESPDFCSDVEQPIFRSIPIHQGDSLRKIRSITNRHTAKFLLFDRAIRGSGDTIDMTHIQTLIYHEKDRKIIVAGGITPENIHDVIAKCRPYGIDVSSGVRAAGYINIRKVMQIQGELV